MFDTQSSNAAARLIIRDAKDDLANLVMDQTALECLTRPG